MTGPGIRDSDSDREQRQGQGQQTGTAAEIGPCPGFEPSRRDASARRRDATVDDGKYHSVDSSEMAFKLAARAGFKAAFDAAGPVVLEPVSKVRITVPPEYQGDVMGDIAARRGAVQGSMANGDGTQTVEAEIPSSEIVRYAIDLRSMTQGWGEFEAELDHYQELPSHLVERALAAAATD